MLVQIVAANQHSHSYFDVPKHPNNSQTYTMPVPAGGSFSNSVENNGRLYFGTGVGLTGTGKVGPIISFRYTSYGFNYAEMELSIKNER